MKKVLSLALAIALGTSPIAVAVVWALWPVHNAVNSASSRLNGVLDGVNGVVSILPAHIVAAHARLDSSLDTLDHQVATVGPVVKKAGPVLDNLSSTEKTLGDAADLTSHRLNDLCPTPTAVDAAIHPCGSLADFNRSLATFRGTSGEVEKSLLVFNTHESDLFTQESTAYVGMNKSVLDFDALVSDTAFKATVRNAATISGNFAAMTTDGKDWLHLKLYPTQKKGFVSGFDATGDAVKHWMPPIF